MRVTVWGTSWARKFGRTHEARRTLKSSAELRSLPEVTAALYNIERGGLVEAVIRMLILLAENRGTVRRDRLERSGRVLTRDEPFRSLTAEQRAMIIHEQTLIATYEPEAAIAALPVLLSTREERELAVRIVQYVPGSIDEMSPHTLELLQRFHSVLGLDPVIGDVLTDPLAEEPAVAPTEGPAVAVTDEAVADEVVADEAVEALADEVAEAPGTSDVDVAAQMPLEATPAVSVEAMQIAAAPVNGALRTTARRKAGTPKDAAT